MSALAGFWTWRQGHSAAAHCHGMLHVQGALGPDRAEMWHDEGLALGFRLRRTLPEDLADRQPLQSRDGRYRLVADLRLDNRVELIERFALRADGPLLADSELLLRWIERDGPAALESLVGDYAIALWDSAERRLFLARDLLGQRPLYFHSAAGFFAFASRPGALHSTGVVPRRPDEERVAGFLGRLRLLGSASFYQGVERVEPGHIVTVSQTGYSTRRCWRPHRQELKLRDFGAYRDAFREEIDRAVRNHMRGAGGVLAAHLSSGWDSGTVAATAARAAPPGCHLVAFTSVPRKGSSPEVPWKRFADEGALAAETAARYPNIEHVLLEGAAKSPIAELDRQAALFDRPLPSLTNSIWLDQIREEAARRGARVLLTGEVGNWSISSAPHFILADLIRQRRWIRWWREARGVRRNSDGRLRGVLAASFGPWIPEPIWTRLRPLSSRAEASVHTALHPRWQERIGRERERQGVGLARRPKDYWATIIEGLRQYDYGDYRAGALAGWGVEERDPTGDRRLIEFCLSLPLDMLLKNGERRPLARAALADRLPPAVLDERRKGYQAADWHEGMTANRGAIRDLLEEIATNELAASLLDIESLRRWIRDWPEGGWEQPHVMARYRGALLNALSAGHFVLHASR